MKKLMVAVAVVALGLSANAMSFNWKYSGVKDDVGQNVYVILGDTAKTDWASTDAIATEAAKLGDGANDDVAKTGSKYTASGKIDSALITSKSQNYYLVLVDKDGKNFKVSDVYAGTGIYDPDNQETGTTTEFTSANFAGEWKPIAAPEPTSGLLFLLGVAGLALKRKQK